MISLDQQISEVKRELALRSAVYPGLVAKKKMRQGEADLHVARMTAALKSLEWMRDHRAEIVSTIERASSMGAQLAAAEGLEQNG